jgi:nitrite reductase/ring-hydroxylating ferredoxin subunit
VDQTAFDQLQGEEGQWRAVVALDRVPEGRAVAAGVDGTTLLLFRSGARIHALANRCSHRGGPLNEGEIDDAAPSVTCPWHASTFNLETGEVLRGPATSPQPRYEARERDGMVEVRVGESG